MSALHSADLPSREELIAGTSRPISRTVKLACLLLAAIGTVAFLIGAFTGSSRMWQALHVSWLHLTTISSAGVVFVAVQRITTARWSRPIIRFLEGYVAFLPVAFIILLLLISVGKGHIFPWTHHMPDIEEKRQYLQPVFFSVRVIGVYLVIAVLSLWYIWTSVRLDVGHVPESGAAWARGIRARMRRGFGEERREIHSTHSLQGKLAVLLALAFGMGWPVLSWDLSMSLDVYFFSTMYGWWVFMGGWVAALASFSILTMAWRRWLGRYDLITEHHFHDLGKLCFAFTAFWGYLTFGQYLIIWYANIAEETHWMRLRLMGVWMPVSLMVVFLMFVLPFFGLLSRAAKVKLPVFAFFASCTIIGLWFHRYAEIYPAIYEVAPALPLGLWELAMALGMVGLWGLCYAAFMDAFPRVRVTLMTSPYRDEVQVPVDPKTMEPLPAHE
ncbi:MAG TPA: hypothetical protein VMM17_05780 [Gemmatimonadaceae bacterium]|nr:hypothetical protein [Gemmatimonadaceae bacterium]